MHFKEHWNLPRRHPENRHWSQVGVLTPRQAVRWPRVLEPPLPVMLPSKGALNGEQREVWTEEGH